MYAQVQYSLQITLNLHLHPQPVLLSYFNCIINIGVTHFILKFRTQKWLVAGQWDTLSFPDLKPSQQIECVIQLNHLLGFISHLDTICHNLQIGDTYINLPSMAMSIAIHICCVPIAKLSNKSSQNMNGNFTISIFNNSMKVLRSQQPFTCDKGDTFEIQKSRKEQKNVEQSLSQVSIHTTNRYQMFDLQAELCVLGTQ